MTKFIICATALVIGWTLVPAHSAYAQTIDEAVLQAEQAEQAADEAQEKVDDLESRVEELEDR